MNSASITCATTWSSTKSRWCSAGITYAIVDEVDSILIDEARTPLIICGEGDKSTDLYKLADNFATDPEGHQVVAELDDKEDQDEQVDGDYVVDEKTKTATLTASGIAKAEKYFNVENLADADEHDAAAPHQPGHQGARRDEAGRGLCGAATARSSSWTNSPAA